MVRGGETSSFDVDPRTLRYSSVDSCDANALCVCDKTHVSLRQPDPKREVLVMVKMKCIAESVFNPLQLCRHVTHLAASSACLPYSLRRA